MLHLLQQGTLCFSHAGSHTFAVLGGSDNHPIPFVLFINGAPAADNTTPMAVAPTGEVQLDLRVLLPPMSMSNNVDLPLALMVDGTPVDGAAVTHDENAEGPVINLITPSAGFVNGE